MPAVGGGSVVAVAAPVIPKRLRRRRGFQECARRFCRSTRDSKEIEAACPNGLTPNPPSVAAPVIPKRLRRLRGSKDRRGAVQVAAPVIPKRLRRRSNHHHGPETVMVAAPVIPKRLRRASSQSLTTTPHPVAAPVIPKRLRRFYANEWTAARLSRSTRDSKEIEAETSYQSAGSGRLGRSVPLAHFDKFGGAEWRHATSRHARETPRTLPILQEISADLGIPCAVSVRNDLLKLP